MAKCHRNMGLVQLRSKVCTSKPIFEQPPVVKEHRLWKFNKVAFPSLFNEWPVTSIQMLLFVFNQALRTTRLHQMELQMEILEALDEEAAERRRVVSNKAVPEAIGTSSETWRTERLKKVLWDKANGIELDQYLLGL